MGVITSAFFLILERFPDRKDMVRRLFGANNDFRILCEDFRECSEALQYWNHSIKTDAPVRRQEYEELQRELAGEIVRFIDEADEQPPNMGEKIES